MHPEQSEWEYRSIDPVISIDPKSTMIHVDTGSLSMFDHYPSLNTMEEICILPMKIELKKNHLLFLISYARIHEKTHATRKYLKKRFRGFFFSFSLKDNCLNSKREDQIRMFQYPCW